MERKENLDVDKSEAHIASDSGDSVQDKELTDDLSMVIVKPAVNAIRILRYLSEVGGSARAVSIARHLSINASTCFNILRTLVKEDVVDFDPLSKTYSTGLGLSKLIGNMLTEGQRLHSAIAPMETVAARFNVTLTLWRRLGVDRIVLVRSVSSPSNVRIEMAEGQRLPLLMGASGRIFGAMLDLSKKELRALFKTLRWQRPLTFNEYIDQLEAIKQSGWAEDEGYFAHGVRTCAVPVADAAGLPVFTLSAVMFMGQHRDDEIVELKAAIQDLAQKLRNILL